MTFLLDTDVVSAMRRPQLLPAPVLEWANRLVLSETRISAITVEEIERGVLLRERSDPPQGAVLRDWFEHTVMHHYRDGILPIDEPAARATARLHVPDKRPYADALLAGTALTHGLTLVARNDAHHKGIAGLALVNPWATGA